MTQYPLELVERRQETPDAVTFVFRAAEASAFAYKAGQFMTFHTEWNGVPIRRCYSLCTAPSEDTPIAVMVKRVPEGRMSNWMCDSLKVGDTLQVEPPEGQFVLDGQSGVLQLFAGGSGITPCMSLAREALRTTERKVQLVYANRDLQSVIFASELDALATEFPERLTVVHHLDSDSGYMSAEQVALHLDPSGSVYVCGPKPFMDLVEAALRTKGIQGGHFERFVSPVDPDRKVTRQVASDAPAPDTFELKVDGESHTVPVIKGESLLGCAKAAGVPAPSSCREGYCGACMAHLVHGDVRMTSTEALSTADIEARRILTCQARPMSKAALAVDFDLSTFVAPTAPPLSWARFTGVIVGAGALIAAVRFLH